MKRVCKICGKDFGTLKHWATRCELCEGKGAKKCIQCGCIFVPGEKFFRVKKCAKCLEINELKRTLKRLKERSKEKDEELKFLRELDLINRELINEQLE
jgi:hypothetical protein